MTEIKLYQSPRKAWQLILWSAPFVLIGVWMAVMGANSWLGWLAVAFFGLCFLMGIYSLFDKKPHVVINEVGVHARSLGRDFINWELIHNAYPTSIAGQKYICLVVDEAYKPSRKKGGLYKNVVKLTEMMGAQELNIHLGQINKIDEVKLSAFIIAMSHAEPANRPELMKELL